MLSFACDYLEGAHPEVLEALIKTNLLQLAPYGEDVYSASAKRKIRELCEKPNADIYFICGGTQTNTVAIATMLEPFEGAITVTSGHINVHESGAIEHSGHKVMAIPGKDGKIIPENLEKYVSAYEADGNAEHMVRPGLVYISHPTEYGTLYTKDELTQISEICHRHGLKLYLDGARLAYGLAGIGTDVKITDIASICDCFYFGGTKCGTYCGEALVFPNGNAPSHFVARIKQKGALMAKGRLPGVMFDALFTDNLYTRIGEHAINMVKKLNAIFADFEIEHFIESPTNQQFFVLDDKVIEKLKPEVGFDYWEPLENGKSAVRFCTNWATTDAMLDELKSILAKALK